ncbi:MFS transporter [Nocardia carnea]|uniref:MFS transporter n=1 Tax=Nocardia carnea TaxID=37328 RepID=UPI0032AF680E
MLLAGRALQGLLCAGIPAVAMAYLVEELDARDTGAAMGIYVAGTSVGGLTGRLIPALGLDLMAWSWAFQAATALAAAFALLFVWRVPASRNFAPRRISVGQSLAELGVHLRDRTLRCLFGLGFLLLGAFMAVYNYLAYRLLDAPFSLPASVVGSVFVLYLAGTVSSAVAGRYRDRFGRGRVLLTAVLVMAAGAGDLRIELAGRPSRGCRTAHHRILRGALDREWVGAGPGDHEPLGRVVSVPAVLLSRQRTARCARRARLRRLSLARAGRLRCRDSHRGPRTRAGTAPNGFIRTGPSRDPRRGHAVPYRPNLIRRTIGCCRGRTADTEKPIRTWG